MKRLKADSIVLCAGITATGTKSAIEDIAIGDCLRIDETDKKVALWYELVHVSWCAQPCQGASTM